MVCGGMAEVFLEVMVAAPVLVVCGGGPVGQALAKAAALAGFEILVVDDRAEFRDPGLFPPGARIAGRPSGAAWRRGSPSRSSARTRCWTAACWKCFR